MFSQGEGVLAVGSGAILVALVQAWYESGLSKLTVLVTNTQPTDIEELKTALEQTLLSDSEAVLNILEAAKDNEVDWEAAVRPYFFIAYVAQQGDLEELQKLQVACLAQKKLLLSAMILRGRGMVGPLLDPEGDGRFASAWRRVHSTVFPENWESQPFSAAASTLLSNLIVNEWHKRLGGEPNCRNQCYLLNPLTLEGSWHPILPHPFLSRLEPVRAVLDPELYLETEHEPNAEEWFSWFSSLTSEVSGIFHVWEEGTLNQLPLAQCLVQPADPLSEGPSRLLPTIVSSALTHAEARRESALAGLESYTARMAPQLVPESLLLQQEQIHIGAGLTFAEAVRRGLSTYLSRALGNRTIHQALILKHGMECTRMEDVQCQFYWQALNILEGEPLITTGESLLGFPVVWVHSGDCWYGGVSLSVTLALRQSLKNALMKTEAASVSSVIWNNPKQQSVTIPSGDPIDHALWVRSAVQILKQQHTRLEVFDLRWESFLREGPVEVVGIMLSEEVSS
ncbi:putative thiazole-containing bacteriocin maturation protein [Paenibacillus cellulosilyticus]|uniref:Putative thiazole-containing bacteriocin maturation protein n=1 Tax=Paenibacillus cellulosilyticus TaxID=375489 RepID=A0A2V2YVV2_9BACL|nr:hypothetical protein [Paenibacillus cellulosilyticus]PWW00965.1 putative thiazole-containing bacteriocin maturation protein [Paenibacillus cellulosilyticus]QKS47610.1 hypothetical protein HUB94_24890 [Paenibacillus cellulosilyticus]